MFTTKIIKKVVQQDYIISLLSCGSHFLSFYTVLLLQLSVSNHFAPYFQPKKQTKIQNRGNCYAHISCFLPLSLTPSIKSSYSIHNLIAGCHFLVVAGILADKIQPRFDFGAQFHSKDPIFFVGHSSRFGSLPQKQMGRHKASILIVLLHLLLLKFKSFAAAENYPSPLNCTDTTRLCTSFLAFKPSPQQTLPVILSMFDVLQEDVTVEGNGRDYVFIKKNCSCALGLRKYLSNTTFTVRENNGSVYGLVRESYDGLAYLPSNITRAARRGSVVSLRLMCGCSSGLWNYLMSYVMQEGDSVESLASRFGVSMDSIESVNEIANPDNVTVGALYYIPLNSGMFLHFLDFLLF